MLRRKSEARIDDDVAVFGIAGTVSLPPCLTGPALRAAMGGMLKGGPVALSIHRSLHNIGFNLRPREVLEGSTAATAVNAKIAPDPDPEDAVARFPGDRVRNISLLCTRLPSVLATARQVHVRIFIARRIPSIGGERPAHECYCPRAFFGPPGGAGAGDGPAAGIGAGRIVEFDRLPRARSVGALKAVSHAEGRRRARRTGQDLDLQVLDQAGPGPALNCGSGLDQVLIQPGDVSGGGLQHP